MPSDLDAAVARLEERCRHGELRRVGVVSADVRLLLADWERLREEESKWSLASQAYLSDAKAAEAERDAARAEVERLRAELGQVTGDPESTSNRRVAAAVGELARLRERDARVREVLELMDHSPDCDPADDWCECGLGDVKALLKETP